MRISLVEVSISQLNLPDLRYLVIGVYSKTVSTPN